MAALLLASALPAGSAASDPTEVEAWLEEVGPLITAEERQLFASLREDYQREAFAREFWRVRDPYPETARNELKERWDERVGFVRTNFRSLADARSRIYLVHGEPDRRVEVRCTGTRIPAEIWLYTRSPHFDFRVVLVFLRERGTGPARLWSPSSLGSDGAIRSASACINGSMLRDVTQGLAGQGPDYQARLARVLSKPLPRSREWVATFAASTTDLPADATLFPARLTVDFLGRHQSRTVVQATLQVGADAVILGDAGGYRSYDFQLVGEVIREGSLLESFRYKFSHPILEEGSAPQRLPMAFQRYLRPGEYRLVLRLEDLNGTRFHRVDRELSVPALDQRVEVRPELDSETAALFREATEAVAAGETAIRLLPPAGELHTGFVRFDTLVAGEEIERVRFLLEDEAILTKTRPPFNVEIDLGELPKPHRLRVEALDGDGRMLADDELTLNAGGYRFRVDLLEPRPSSRYRDSLRARAAVVVPEGQTLDRIELFLNETRVASIYQEPFVQPIVLPEGGGPAYVRAVAYLADGNSTEDVVFVNAPDVVEEVEIQFVELYATAVDRAGRPVEDLDRTELVVEEDGRRQDVTRFERVEDLPIHVTVLIDNSASMQPSLGATRAAALSFFASTLRERDRAAVITFNRFPEVRVRMTNDLQQLGGGLAGLTAEGQTALYDSVMFGLYYFAGVSGQRALLLLSDGRDEVSRFSAEETLEYARRAGVTVYTVGLGASAAGARRFLVQLAEETGGQSFFIGDASELEAIYDRVERELRSQYLIAYQSSNARNDNGFRQVSVRALRDGITVKTMTGYYP